jgi:hypothetical protein
MYQTSFIWVSLASEPEVLDGGVVATAREDVREGKLAHLAGGGLDQLLVAVAQRGAPEARHRLNVGLSVHVVDVDSLGVLQHERANRPVGIEIGVGMDQRLDVTRLQIGEHGFPLRQRIMECRG